LPMAFANLPVQIHCYLIRWLKPMAMDNWQEPRHELRYPNIRAFVLMFEYIRFIADGFCKSSSSNPLPLASANGLQWMIDNSLAINSVILIFEPLCWCSSAFDSMSMAFANLPVQIHCYLIRWLKPNGNGWLTTVQPSIPLSYYSSLCADVRVHSIHCRWLLQIFQFKSIAVWLQPTDYNGNEDTTI